MNSLEQYTNHFNSDDSYSSVESSRNLILPHPLTAATEPSTSALSVASTKSSMTTSSYIGDDNSMNAIRNVSYRSKSIEDASQGLLSIRKRKAERRPTTIALPASTTAAIDQTSILNTNSSDSAYPNTAIVNYSDVPPRGKRLRRQSSSSAIAAAAAAAVAVVPASTKPSKQAKKNEIISIAQKSLKEAMGILAAFQESSPSSSTVASITPSQTNPTSPSKNDQHSSVNSDSPCTTIPAFNPVQQDSHDTNASSSPATATPSSVNQRIKQLEDGILQVQTNFNREMNRLEKELKELKQASAPNEAFALEHYSKHVQDSFKASKLLNNDNNNNSINTKSSSSPSFYLAPRGAVPFTSYSQNTPAASAAFVPTPETTNATTTPSTITASTATTTSDNSVITQPTDKDVISGRGHGANRHGGNQIYRHLVKKYKFPYVKAISDLDKHNISMQVVNEIHEGGGRFLKRVYGNGNGNGNRGIVGGGDIQWAIMDMMEVKKKVGQALRENASEVRDILLKQSAAVASSSAKTTISSAPGTTTSSPAASPALVSTQNFPIIAKSPSPIHMGGDAHSAIKMSPTHSAPTSPASSPVLSQGFSNPRIAPSA